MRHHVDHGAGGCHAAAHEYPEDHKAEVAHRGVGDEPVEVVLADGGQTAVDDADHRQDADGGSRPPGRLREDGQQDGDHAVGADLVQDPDEQHGGTRGGLLGGVGKPGVQRHHGGLDGQGGEDTQEYPAAHGR